MLISSAYVKMSWWEEFSSIIFITLNIKSSGLLLLCPPFTISRYLLFPEKESNNFCEWLGFTNISSSPWINTIVVVGWIFFTSPSMFNSPKENLPFFSISEESLQNTQGNKQLIFYPHALLAVYFLAYIRREFTEYARK